MRLADALRRPRIVLAALVAAQWASIAAVALAADHNGWLYYAGGDETWYYTSAWVVGGGDIPYAAIGYGWPLVLAPITWVAGPALVAAVPWVVALNALVLAPTAVVCVYALGSRIAGRSFGYVAAAAWVAAPWVVLPWFVARYRDLWIDQFLPQATGLTLAADYPSMVLLLVAAYLVVRAVETCGTAEAVAAGLVAGFALAVKPSNAPFVAAAVLVPLVARSIRLTGAFVAAVAPAVVTLTLWKVRGLGDLQVLAFDEVRVAAASNVAPVVAVSLGDYLRVDWGRLMEAHRDLNEHTQSGTLIVWAALAGSLALARHAPRMALLATAWVASFLLIKGSVGVVETATFFRHLMPAFPAFLLLILAAPLVLPRLRLPAAAAPPARLARRMRLRLAAAATVLLAAVPLAVVLLARPLDEPRAVREAQENWYIPISDELDVVAENDGGDTTLRWSPPPAGGAQLYYRVYMADPEQSCTRDGIFDCVFVSAPIVITDDIAWRGARRPGASYVVGASGDWRRDSNSAPLFLLSRPVTPHDR